MGFGSAMLILAPLGTPSRSTFRGPFWSETIETPLQSFQQFFLEFFECHFAELIYRSVSLFSGLSTVRGVWGIRSIHSITKATSATVLTVGICSIFTAIERGRFDPGKLCSHLLVCLL